MLCFFAKNELNREGGGVEGKVVADKALKCAFLNDSRLVSYLFLNLASECCLSLCHAWVVR